MIARAISLLLTLLLVLSVAIACLWVRSCLTKDEIQHRATGSTLIVLSQRGYVHLQFETGALAPQIGLLHLAAAPEWTFNIGKPFMDDAEWHVSHLGFSRPTCIFWQENLDGVEFRTRAVRVPYSLILAAFLIGPGVSIFRHLFKKNNRGVGVRSTRNPDITLLNK